MPRKRNTTTTGRESVRTVLQQGFASVIEDVRAKLEKEKEKALETGEPTLIGLNVLALDEIGIVSRQIFEILGLSVPNAINTKEKDTVKADKKGKKEGRPKIHPMTFEELVSNEKAWQKIDGTNYVTAGDFSSCLVFRSKNKYAALPPILNKFAATHPELAGGYLPKKQGERKKVLLSKVFCVGLAAEIGNSEVKGVNLYQGKKK